MLAGRVDGRGGRGLRATGSLRRRPRGRARTRGVTGAVTARDVIVILAQDRPPSAPTRHRAERLVAGLQCVRREFDQQCAAGRPEACQLRGAPAANGRGADPATSSRLRASAASLARGSVRDSPSTFSTVLPREVRAWLASQFAPTAVAAVTVFAEAESITTLSPVPPSRTSVPGPPISTSSPAPPSSVSAPLPPIRMSSPSPPVAVRQHAGGQRRGVDHVVAGQRVDGHAVAAGGRAGDRDAGGQPEHLDVGPGAGDRRHVVAVRRVDDDVVGRERRRRRRRAARSGVDAGHVGPGQVVDGDGVGRRRAPWRRSTRRR